MSVSPALHEAARLRLAPVRRPTDAGRRARRPAPVPRPRLVLQLAGTWRPLVVIVAPAGFGKSTLLAQWRGADPRPFHTVSLDDGAWPATPSVLVLDGCEDAEAAVAQLAESVPPGSTLALSSRSEPAVPLGRMRAEDAVVELRADALAMTRAEGAELLRRAGVELDDGRLDGLLELTGGWPAALQLAARAIRSQDDAAFGGDDGIVGEYVREEVLSGLSARDLAFLRRTSVLDVLEGRACDAVLDAEGSALRLRKLARANVPLVREDRAELEYRHHPLLAQALRAELVRVEPELERVLHCRASAWHEGEGDLEQAIEHAVSARDADRAAALLDDRSAAFVASGRGALVDGWLDRLGPRAVAARPALALTAAVARLGSGERDAAERWVSIAATRCDDAATPARAALVRAWGAPDGVERMAADARDALATAPEHGPWRSLACLVEGAALCLGGHRSDAAARLDEGARGAVFDAPVVRSLCLALLSFLAEDADEAEALAAGARGALGRAGGEQHPLGALTFALSAAARARRGQLDSARHDVSRARHGLAALADAPPWYGALARLAIARVQLKLSDAAEGRRLLSEASRLRRQVAGAVALEAWIVDGWELADDFAAGPVACPSTLTMAELRVLRLLPSHLSFREIASRLHVSPNTVKTQAHAVYRKLDARSRSEAVDHATAIGLVEA